MSKKPAKNSGGDDLPEELAAAYAAAREGSWPTLSDTDKLACPVLFEFLAPRMVRDPRYRGTGEPPLVLREPLAMLSWNRRAGQWQVTLTDKILNLSTSVLVEGLGDALRSVEQALASHLVKWTERKPR